MTQPVLTLIGLVEEIMATHRDRESHDYNECEKVACHWCEQATVAIQQLKHLRADACELQRQRTEAWQTLQGLAARGHLHVEEDPWLSCHMAAGCVHPEAGSYCNCGAERHNAEVASVTVRLRELQSREEALWRLMI